MSFSTSRPVRASRGDTKGVGGRKDGVKITHGGLARASIASTFVTAPKNLLRSMVSIASVCASNRLAQLQDAHFSNNPSSTFGPPSFASAAFAYNGGTLHLPVQL